jgi:hypothetical protein
VQIQELLAEAVLTLNLNQLSVVFFFQFGISLSIAIAQKVPSCIVLKETPQKAIV